MIYLSAGHHPGAKGAYNPEFDIHEHDACHNIVHAIYDMMQRDWPITLVPPVSLSRKVLYINSESVKLNAMSKRIAVEVHLNACPEPNTGRGHEVLHYPGSPMGIALATYISQAMTHYLPFTSRYIKARDDLAFLRDTSVPSVIVEPLFLNNHIEASYLLNEHSTIILARAISAGIGRYMAK